VKKKATAKKSRPKSVTAPAAVASARRMPRTALGPASLLSEVRELILQTRQTVAQGVNSALVLLYWQIGQRIRTDILKEKRAEYGEQIVSALSAQLTEEFGRGFGARSLFRMVRFAEVFPDVKIVSALRTQLGWTHLRQIIAIDDPLKFLAALANPTTRKKLESVKFEDAPSDPAYDALRQASQRFRSAVNQLFFDEHPKLPALKSVWSLLDETDRLFHGGACQG
jgi:hypothetical protein